MWWPLCVLIYVLSFFVLSIFVPKFFWLSTFFVFKAGSPPYLCHLCRLPNCVTFCVSHFVCQIMFVTLCVSHCVSHCVGTIFVAHYVHVTWGSKVMLRLVICDKYCMAHGCATRKNLKHLPRKYWSYEYISYFQCMNDFGQNATVCTFSLIGKVGLQATVWLVTVGYDEIAAIYWSCS